MSAKAKLWSQARTLQMKHSLKSDQFYMIEVLARSAALNQELKKLMAILHSINADEPNKKKAFDQIKSCFEKKHLQYLEPIFLDLKRSVALSSLNKEDILHAFATDKRYQKKVLNFQNDHKNTVLVEYIVQQLSAECQAQTDQISQTQLFVKILAMHLKILSETLTQYYINNYKSIVKYEKKRLFTQYLTTSQTLKQAPEKLLEKENNTLSYNYLSKIKFSYDPIQQIQFTENKLGTFDKI